MELNVSRNEPPKPEKSLDMFPGKQVILSVGRIFVGRFPPLNLARPFWASVFVQSHPPGIQPWEGWHVSTAPAFVSHTAHNFSVWLETQPPRCISGVPLRACHLCTPPFFLRFPSNQAQRGRKVQTRCKWAKTVKTPLRVGVGVP